MKLCKGEFVLLEPSDYCEYSLYGEEAYIRNLKLTNFAIVFDRAENKKRFKKFDYEEERILFSDVNIVGGRPQVFGKNHPSSDMTGAWLLQIFTKTGGKTIEFSFDSEEEKEIHRDEWLKQINQIITGVPCEEVAVSDGTNVVSSSAMGAKTGKAIGHIVGSAVEGVPIIGGVASKILGIGVGAIGGVVGGIVGGVGGMFSKKKMQEQQDEEKITCLQGKCKGCHAALIGLKGSFVTCVYCDTEQTIE